MKILALLFAALPLWGAVTNVRVTGVTAQQAVVKWTTTDGVGCTVVASTTNLMGLPLAPYAHDTDESIFTGSTSDSRPGSFSSGTLRTFVIGQRTSQLATTGNTARHYSRSLQAATPYWGVINCGASAAPFTFTTNNIPLGITYGDPWLSDPANPGDQPWPESLGGLTPESFIDPLRGTNQQRISMRGGQWQVTSRTFASAYNQGKLTPCDVSAGLWTSPCNIAPGPGSTTIGNSTARLVLRPTLTSNGAFGTTWYNSQNNIDQLSVQVTGFISSTANPNIDACLSFNGGVSCASAFQQFPLTTLSSILTFGSSPTSSFSTGTYGTIPWLLDTNPRFNMQEAAPHAGTGTVSGSTLTNTSSVNSYLGGSIDNDYFSLYWITGGGGQIGVSAASQAAACSDTAAEYSIVSFTDGNDMVLAGSPPSGSVFWCENNFAVMLWRDAADAATVTLTAASMNSTISGYPSYPDNGAGTACYSQLVYGGYFCLFGDLYWVNPAGTVVWYGQPQAKGADNTGTNIANSWVRVTAPTPESASIDQNQLTNLTFYMVSYDPASAGPLVIQGIMNPCATPTQSTVPQSPIGIPQINYGSVDPDPVSGTTAYAVNWKMGCAGAGQGLTFTNLTPQSTAAESIVNQTTPLDPLFTSTLFAHSSTGGWNCSLVGAMSTGVFYFECLTVGGDSPGAVIAFSPGDGNPAHAGLAGGPQVIGEINSYNTPRGAVAPGQAALTGRSLHAISETGETGWLAVDGNEYKPVNTSATTIAGSGPHACTFYGLAGNSNDCILLQINSHTSGGGTGYEPYLNGCSGQDPSSCTPSNPAHSPFLGSPGELRTTQIGDTACVATSPTICAWEFQANELMTLMIKNYGAVPGAWVFQRNTFGAEKSTSGTVTLYWDSYQSDIPVGAAAVSGAVQVYWNPLTGCAGSPDPHGDCMIQDPNEFHGHAEWRNGGESQAVNVGAWRVPGGSPFSEIFFPNIYQTLVGPVPGILQYAAANVTPGAVTGVNFVQPAAPFAGAYGVPFQPDAGSHPNAAGVNAQPNESIRAFDNIPVQGGSYDPTFTLVSGQLYAYTPGTVTDADDFYTSGSVAAINRKLMATGASCGSHPLIDVSSAATGNVISTSTASSYTYSVVRNANEARTGSTAGQIYVNCPGVSSFNNSPTNTIAFCNGVAAHGGVPLGVGNDMCVANIAANADAVSQYTLDRTDFAGARSRQLVSATSRLRMVTGFEGNQLLPDNSWLLYRQEFLNYQAPQIWMSQMPAYPPPDSVNRGTYEPIAITVNPPSALGVNNAVVEFGYMEFAHGLTYYCTTRADVCQANAATVPSGNAPFVFASEAAAGLACSTGCTISIPAIPNRTLYYRVRYRNGSNVTLALGPWTVSVTP